MDSIQVAIHAAIVDTRELDKELISSKVNTDLVNTYFRHKGVWKVIYGVGYYFFEKEVKDNLMKKHVKKFNSSNKNNTFFNPERTAFAYRSNLAHHYSLANGTSKKTSSTKIPGYSDPQLDNLSNDYILGGGMFAGKNDAESKKLFEETLTQYMKNNAGFSAYAKTHCKDCDLTSDILLQLESYRANIALVKSITVPTFSQAGFTIAVNNYISRFQQQPLCLRLLGFSQLDQEVWNALPTEETKAKLQQLLEPVYSVNLHAIPATKPFGKFDLAKSPYSSMATRVGLFLKWLPWRSKMLLVAAIIGVTAFLGGRVIVALPIVMLLKQFFKTKADYLHSTSNFISRFATHNSIEQTRKQDVLEKKLKLSKKEKDTHMVYTKIQPNLLDNPPFADELANNIIKNIVEYHQEQLKNAVDIALAHITFQQTKQVPTFAVQRRDLKEQTILFLYKSVILGSGLLGYDLINGSNSIEYTRSSAFKTFTNNYNNILKKSRRAFHAHSSKYALRDGAMSGVVAGFTSWLGGAALSPTSSGMVAYAASDLFELTIAENSPLYDYLMENDLDPKSHEFSQEEIDTILEDNSDVRLEGEQFVLTSEAKNLDVKLLDELQEILPKGVYDDFIAHLQSDETATLWDTMIDIAGEENGNMYSHEIVDQIWKADANGSSEIFMRSVENGLPVDSASASQWDDIMSLLDRTYNYEGFENYQKWLDKDWLTKTMMSLSENDFSVDDIAELTKEQRAVLTHASFINIDTNDIKDILLDYSGQEEVIGSLDSSDGLVDGASDDGRESTDHTHWRDIHTDGSINATPIPFGKNTYIQGPAKAVTTNKAVAFKHSEPITQNAKPTNAPKPTATTAPAPSAAPAASQAPKAPSAPSAPARPSAPASG